MPISFYDEENETIVRISPPSAADVYLRNSTDYAAAHARLSVNARYHIINLSENKDELRFWQNIPQTPKRNESPIFKNYLTKYPSAKIMTDGKHSFLVIDDPQDIVMLKLSNSGKMY